MQKTETPNLSSKAADSRDVRNPSNYFSKLPVYVGAIGGVLGSFAIIAVITTLALGFGYDIFLSPRAIASVLIGEAAFNAGILPVILGTVMHLIAGAMYGALFAYIVPTLPRAFWFVVGLLFGMATWGIAVVVLPFTMHLVEIPNTAYFSGLIIAHATYGIVLGITGSVYGYRQARSATAS